MTKLETCLVTRVMPSAWVQIRESMKSERRLGIPRDGLRTQDATSLEVGTKGSREATTQYSNQLGKRRLSGPRGVSE